MISVIVPIYNTETYLRECLDSLRAQTYTDFEVILVNDGSTDGSVAIAEEFVNADKRFKLISQANAGQSVARNVGVEKSCGDYIFFLDSDDAIHPSALECLLDAFEKHPEVDMSMTQLICSRMPKYYMSDKYTIFGGEELLRSTLYQKRGTHNNPSARLIRRSVIERAGKFHPGRIYEDLEYSVPLYSNCAKIAVSDSVVLFYRKRLGSTVNTWKPKKLDVLDVVDDICGMIDSQDKKMQAAAASRRFSAYFDMFLQSSKNGYREGEIRTWPVIKSLRRQMLVDPNVRLKNKLGALLSYLGSKITALFAYK